MRITDKGIPH